MEQNLGLEDAGLELPRLSGLDLFAAGLEPASSDFASSDAVDSVIIYTQVSLRHLMIKHSWGTDIPGHLRLHVCSATDTSVALSMNSKTEGRRSKIAPKAPACS